MGQHYCKYHQSDTYWKEDCSTMKKIVARLAISGELERMLVEYIKLRIEDGWGQEPRQSSSPKIQRQEREQRHDAPHQPHSQNQAPLEESRTVAGGFASGGVTTSSRKAHTCKARYHEVYIVDKPSKHTRLGTTPTISFGDEDCQGILYPHDDALIVTLLIANYTTRRILIDNGSSANILFCDAFAKIDISPVRLCPSPTPLKGFSGEVVQPMAAITLPVTVDQDSHMETIMTDFLVFIASSSYNAILGCPTLNNQKVVTSTYHLKMKFPMETGVDEVQGEQILL
ncbi:uncharacterized protein LOC121240872 [Juglans microcarpa x Juglans regia]|uniref:uncharacterized protein LOC121240872 n=1 Tax=Juglans microcarpa x Juglans regia TaxID=2249226 RepID=UPI001B7F5706|nr:uncharacterized protein LOC121240872 [Juglans microcarpa x Juglans regia]